MELSDFFNPPSPEQFLYHYTSIDSLVSISTHGTLRAGHVAYMNDAMELRHAGKKLRETLAPMLAFGGLPKNELQFYKDFEDWLDQQLDDGSPCFIFSLSENGNLLSQWRSYTKPGKGVVIGFSAERLDQICTSNSLLLARCVYKQQDQSDLMFGVARRLHDTFYQSGAPDSHQSRRAHFQRFVNDIFHTLALIKDSTFEEEAEWRLIAFNQHSREAIKYREGPFMLSPYVDLNIKVDSTNQIFDSLLLGPTQHQELALRAATQYLKEGGYCPFVSATEIPFRHW